MSRKETTALSKIKQSQSETDAIREAPEPVRTRATIWSLTGLLVACLALGFEMRDRLGREAFGEKAVGEVVCRIVTRMRARNGS